MLIYDQELFSQMAIVFIIYLIIITAIALATYIINALFLYKAGKDLNASSLWMAWVPVVSSYFTGKLAYSINGDNDFFKKFKISFWLMLLIPVFTIPFSFIMEKFNFNAISASMMLTLMVFCAIAAVFFTVMYFMALYRILIFYDQDKGTLYLILMILFPIAQPIIFILMMNRIVGKGYVKPQKPLISDNYNNYNN